MIEYISRKILHKLPAEQAHNLSIKMLASPFSALVANETANNPIKLMGLTFPNPVGLAAGYDKNADAICGLPKLGFGFIEVGTITPKAQPGNSQPRLFRLPKNRAIINRMGFNNKGVDYLVKQLENHQYSSIIGINIGKNKITPNEHAADDYIHCFNRVQHLADYITVNISSPNTQDLRKLQESDNLKALLEQLKNIQQEHVEKGHKYTPIVVKIAPDQNDKATIEMATIIKQVGMDGIICTNTTVDKSLLSDEPNKNQSGGMSGQPLLKQSNHIINLVRNTVGKDFPIIGVGGILTDEDAMSKIESGADLVQIYTGLIYHGPQLIRDINKKIKSKTYRT